jgi:hypothetical protein
VKEDLDGAEDNTARGVFKSVLKHVHNVEHFLFAFGLVLTAEVEYDRLPPFIEIADAVQQLSD